MLVRRVTQVYAVLVGGLAVLGLFSEGHLFGLMNVDMMLDILRIVLAAGLVYAGFVAKDDKVPTTALMIVGVLYLGMGLLGVVSPTLGGMLPSGLTGFDVAFHLATGIAAVGVAGMKAKDAPSRA